MADRTRERLTEMRNGLLKLHKTLLDSERAVYERDVARISSTGQYLNLVLDDPWFAWLHELSQFIVLVDETLDFEDPATEADAERRGLPQGRRQVPQGVPGRAAAAAMG